MSSAPKRKTAHTLTQEQRARAAEAHLLLRSEVCLEAVALMEKRAFEAMLHLDPMSQGAEMAKHLAVITVARTFLASLTQAVQVVVAGDRKAPTVA